jgi:RHS repeat-associated protein
MAYWPGGQRALLQDATGTHLYVGGVSERHKSPTGVYSATRSYTIGATMVAVRNKTTGGPVSITALFGDRSGSITLGYTSSVAGGSQAEWYEPYGARRAGGIDATHRGWIGQTTDTTSGLNYLNHRYYDPTLGIFLSVDPLVDKTGQAYLYANGNPSTLSDPNGLDPCSHNGTCSGEYADQKDIANYNQSHGSPTVSKCNYQCALRSGTWGNGEGGFNRTAPSTMMYMKPASASQTVGLLLGVTLIAAAIVAAIALSPAEAIGASTPVVEELIDSGAGNQAQGAAQQVATEAESGAMSQMDRVGSGLKDDPLHRATSWVVDDPAAQQFTITGGDGVPRTLYQLPGEVNGKPGVFEWIVDSSGTDSVITHQQFIPGGQVTGLPNQP